MPTRTPRSRCPSTSPTTRRSPRRRSEPNGDSAASTCWSTTPATATAPPSRRATRRTSPAVRHQRLRPGRACARRCCRACGVAGPVRSSTSPRSARGSARRDPATTPRPRPRWRGCPGRCAKSLPAGHHGHRGGTRRFPDRLRRPVADPVGRPIADYAQTAGTPQGERHRGRHPAGRPGQGRRRTHRGRRIGKCARPSS